MSGYEWFLFWMHIAWFNSCHTLNYLLLAWNGSISIGFISCRPIKLEFNPKLNSTWLSSQTALFFWILWLQSYVEKCWVGKYSDFAYVLFMYWVARYHCEQKYVRFASKWFSSLKLFTIWALNCLSFCYYVMIDGVQKVVFLIICICFIFLLWLGIILTLLFLWIDKYSAFIFIFIP